MHVVIVISALVVVIVVHIYVWMIFVVVVYHEDIGVIQITSVLMHFHATIGVVEVDVVIFLGAMEAWMTLLHCPHRVVAVVWAVTSVGVGFSLKYTKSDSNDNINRVHLTTFTKLTFLQDVDTKSRFIPSPFIKVDCCFHITITCLNNVIFLFLFN